MEGTSSRKRRNHVFLFRHCVRSTESVVNLFHDVDGVVGKEQNASDFTASPLPDWNTPAMWCTEKSMRIMKKTGIFLMNLMTISADPQVKSMRVQFISDTSQRDVDTAFALSRGMADAASSSEISVDGLTDIIYDPVLFSPLNASGYFPLERANGALCEKNYTQDQLEEDIRARLKKLAPVRPDPGLKDTLSLLDDLGGVGVAGPLAAIRPLRFTLVQDEKNHTRLEGGVNVIKLFAQMMFYSRAGADPPYFLPNATVPQVYQMLAWVHWSRSVLSVRNAEAATDGSVLARAVIEALEHGEYKPDRMEGLDDYDTTATIIVGHDGNLDALGTALGVKWKLKRPYVQADDYSPTPPGSAFHASHSLNDGGVELSYLYPVFLRGHGTTNKIKSDGKLESVPLMFDPPGDAGRVFTNSTMTTITAEGNSSGLDFLRSRVLSVLQQYPGATECYHKLPVESSTTSSSSPVSVSWGLQMSYALMSVAVVVGMVAICLLYQLGRRGRKEATKPKEVYNVVSSEVELV